VSNLKPRESSPELESPNPAEELRESSRRAAEQITARLEAEPEPELEPQLEAELEAELEAKPEPEPEPEPEELEAEPLEALELELEAKQWRAVLAELRPAVGGKREHDCTRVITVTGDPRAGEWRITAGIFAELEIVRTICHVSGLIGSGGSVAVHHAALVSGLKGARGPVSLAFSADGSRAELRTSSSSLQLVPHPLEEIPRRLAETHKPEGSVTLDAGELRDACAYVFPACATDDPRYSLAAARFRGRSNPAVFSRLEATDGHRLHYVELEHDALSCPEPLGKMAERVLEIIIPRSVVQELSRRLEPGERRVTLERAGYAGEGSVSTADGRLRYYWTGAGDCFPDTDRVIPKRSALAEYRLEPSIVNAARAAMKPYAAPKSQVGVLARFGSELELEAFGGEDDEHAALKSRLPLVLAHESTRPAGMRARYFSEALAVPGDVSVSCFVPEPEKVSADAIRQARGPLLITGGGRFTAVVMPRVAPAAP
jgi:hypothetical protein